MEKASMALRSVTKKYSKAIWGKFTGAIKDYNLIEKGDKIAVCISGGKDSMLLAVCMQQLQKHSKTPFEVRYLVMDPGYSAANRKKIADNAAALNIPIEIFDTDIFEVVDNVPKSPCYLCARMRRGWLYKLAQQAGCNKIALGHHFDDVTETVMMSILFGGEIKSMPPKLRSANYAGMELIRPLYLVREADIIAWTRYNDLNFIRCACRVTKDDETTHNSKRAEVKQLLNALRLQNPQVDDNIFKSIHNVRLDTLPRYIQNGVVHDFNDRYAEITEE
ncbi:MAG: ATP-binding protein [Oscillospiraceae bacterium]|nr:ATP-binding protein [Oscillospiraceae bacterium]